MPVLMGLCHLFQDLYKVLVGKLYCTIHLWPIRRGSMMSDLEALKIVFDPPSYEVRAIVRDDGVWDSIPGYNVVPDEFLCSRGYDSFV